MSDDFERYMKWLTRAAKLEGLILAHRELKGDKGDVYDENLWRLTVLAVDDE
jgi:hypothetical protein